MKSSFWEYWRAKIMTGTTKTPPCLKSVIPELNHAHARWCIVIVYNTALHSHQAFYFLLFIVSEGFLFIIFISSSLMISIAKFKKKIFLQENFNQHTKALNRGFQMIFLHTVFQGGWVGAI